MAKQVMKVVFLAFLAVASISQADLVAWYQLDDAFAACGDTVVNTLSGEQGAWGDGIISDRNAVGTILSYADSVQGVANKGLHLIDYSSAINSNHIAVDTGNKLADGSDFTLMGWAKTPAGGTHQRSIMFGQYSGTGTTAGNMIFLPADRLNGYKARLFLGTNCPALLSPQAYNDGKWHHVAATYDGSVARLYVDGVEVASASFTGIVFNPISNLVIGNLSDIAAQRIPTTGTYDELRVYTSALTAAEIQDIYNYRVIIEQTDGATQVAEGDYADSYYVSLAGAPAVDVVVKCLPDSSLDLGNGGGEEIQLTFTTANWATPQEVIVEAVDDEAFKGFRYENITHTTTGSDENFNLFNPDSIQVAIIEDDVNLASGLRAFYRFDEQFGAVMTNSVYGLPATLGHPTTVSTVATGVAGYSGTGITVSATGAVDTGISFAANEVFTLTGWAKTPAAPLSNFMFGQYSNEGSSANNFYLSAAHNTQGYKARLLVNGAGYNTTSSYNDNQWHFYAVVYDGDYMKLYIDGELELNLSAANLATNLNSNLVIGNLSNVTGQRLTVSGNYDEVKIFSTALSAADISAMYEAKIEMTETDGKTEVLEGGYSDSYSFVLASQPSANVSILCSPTAELDLGSGAGVDKTITFTTANWATPQTVTVNAVDNSEYDGSRIATITHSISTTDDNYSILSLNDLEVSIIDDEISLDNGLVAHYRLDYKVNEILLNSVYGVQGAWGHGSLSVESTATAVANLDAVAGTSATLSGQIAFDTGEQLLTGDIFTLTGWAKTPANLGSNFLFGQYNNELTIQNNFYLSAAHNTQGYKARLVVNGAGYNTADRYDDSQWHFYAVTYDGANMKVYVDGEEEISVAVAFAGNSNSNLVVGNLSNVVGQKNPIGGNYDEVRIYKDSALSQTDIKKLYTRSLYDIKFITNNEGVRVGQSVFEYDVYVQFNNLVKSFDAIEFQLVGLPSNVLIPAEANDTVSFGTMAAGQTAYSTAGELITLQIDRSAVADTDEVLWQATVNPLSQASIELFTSSISMMEFPSEGFDFDDLLEIANTWLSEGAADINNDGIVNYEDFAILSNN